jgi:flagellar basal body-associated protein FliL
MSSIHIIIIIIIIIIVVVVVVVVLICLIMCLTWQSHIPPHAFNNEGEGNCMYHLLLKSIVT